MCFWHERNPLSDALQYQSFSFRHESASWKRMMKVCLWSRSENAFALTTIKILLTTVHPPLITVPNCIFDWSIISSIAILPFQWMLTYFNVFKWKHKMQLMTRMTIDDAMQSKTFEIHSLSGIGQVSLTFRTLNWPTLISFHFKKL